MASRRRDRKGGGHLAPGWGDDRNGGVARKGQTAGGAIIALLLVLGEEKQKQEEKDKRRFSFVAGLPAAPVYKSRVNRARLGKPSEERTAGSATQAKQQAWNN